MGLIDNNHVSPLLDVQQSSLHLIVFTIQIRMIKDLQLAKGAGYMRHVFTQGTLPNSLPSSLWHKEGDVFSFNLVESLNQHHSYKGFAQSDTVTKKCPTMLGSNSQQVMISILLIAG